MLNIIRIETSMVNITVMWKMTMRVVITLQLAISSRFCSLVFIHRMKKTRQCWINMAIAYLARLPLPLVELIKVDDAYFVCDGHHCISVTRIWPVGGGYRSDHS